MNILAIETSCDETSAAVIRDGSEILSNVISSQIEFHKKYGGIVPEVAARKHVEVVNLVIKEALETAKLTFKDINAVAVTYGPGLVGSLLVGVCAAKAIAYALNIPLIGVNHLEGHIYANFMNSKSQAPNPNQYQNNNTQILNFPFISLLVSGGHTMIVLVKDHGKYEVLGRTRDDAAGEAFDKVARFLGLGYPGGPVIDKLAKEGNPKAIEFKRPMIEKEFGYDFSFSGIKTGVVNYVNRQKTAVSCEPLADIVASFQQAIVDVLVIKTIQAAKDNNCKTITLAGGVSANSRLREDLQKKGQEQGLEVIIPPFILCTDNAAMIGCAGYHRLKNGETSNFSLAPTASLRL
ncbi:MAG: tRNA (adenosine(37)-N6)-threonylcarbamoyltransferase complex transferase subunit TsaD [Candidatus Margulisiibacteriota bacterium]